MLLVNKLKTNIFEGSLEKFKSPHPQRIFALIYQIVTGPSTLIINYFKEPTSLQ